MHPVEIFKLEVGVSFLVSPKTTCIGFNITSQTAHLFLAINLLLESSIPAYMLIFCLSTESKYSLRDMPV